MDIAVLRVRRDMAILMERGDMGILGKRDIAILREMGMLLY